MSFYQFFSEWTSEKMTDRSDSNTFSQSQMTIVYQNHTFYLIFTLLKYNLKLNRLTLRVTVGEDKLQELHHHTLVPENS